jgi:hypothetical protein
MKKIILVAAPPACGKNYVCDKIASSLSSPVYIDKDDLSVFVDKIFSLTGEKPNRDGEFFVKEVRPLEYEAIKTLALSAINYSDTVIINAPFLKEVREGDYIREFKKAANERGARLVLVWVYVKSKETLYSRMKKRAAARDEWKLQNFDEYVKTIDFSAPSGLLDNGDVDGLYVFENGDGDAFRGSLENLLKFLNED